MVDEIKENITKYIVNLLIIVCVAVMALQFTHYNVMHTASLIGPTSILIILFIYFLIYIKQIIVTKHSVILMCITTIFFVYYIFNINENYQLDIHYLLYLTIIYFMFLVISINKDTFIIYPMWTIFVFLYSNIVFLPMLIEDTRFINSNGLITFLLLFFCMMSLSVSNKIFRVLNIYTIILLLIIIYDTNSRTTILALLIVLFIYLFWNKIRTFIKPLILSIIGLSVLITFIYINIRGTEIGSKLNEISLKYTDKSLFSGRQRLWEGAINEVVESSNVWFGLGNNVRFELLNGYLHSLYVQLFYQGGIIGLMLFICVLGIIIIRISKIKNSFNNHRNKTLVSFFVGILILQIFEGQLIYSFSIISIFSWMILALMINKTFLNIEKSI